jgi:hypothetical protein
VRGVSQLAAGRGADIGDMDDSAALHKCGAKPSIILVVQDFCDPGARSIGRVFQLAIIHHEFRIRDVQRANAVFRD